MTTGLPTQIIENADEMGVSGFQSIKRVRGVFASQTLKDSKFADKQGNKGEQLEVTINDAEVLEKFPNAIGNVELKDDKFTFWLKYNKVKGQPPHGSSPYNRIWVGSAKKVYGKPPSELIGQVVVLENTDHKFPDENGKDVKYRFWAFVADEGGVAIDDYMRSILVGLNPSAALRVCMMDARAKQHPEFSTACQNGTLAEKLGLKVVDEVFAL